MATVLKLSPSCSPDDLVANAAAIISQGGALAYPTETFYGLGVDATSEKAVRKIFDIKGRDFKNPVSVIIGNRDQMNPLVVSISETAQKLMDAFWPGPLTLVFEASENVSPLLTAGTGKVGVRLSGHDFARRLALAAGRPITATSANLSGAPECSDADAVMRQLADKIDAVIDLGEKGGMVGSTIIDVTTKSLLILRQGVIAACDIEHKTGLRFETNHLFR